VLPPDNINLGLARAKLGDTLLRERRYSDAEGELVAAYEIMRKRLSPSSWNMQKIREFLVADYTALEQPQKAAGFRAEMAANR
jgi:eukaryotic-like serine/threonine-protein kinase